MYDLLKYLCHGRERGEEMYKVGRCVIVLVLQWCYWLIGECC